MPEEKKAPALPELQQGETAQGQPDSTGNQHFTQPPPRYTEASLIKALEENGIGRPSTYAPTITTIIQRGYVERDGKSLVPTQLGEVTTDLMEEQFSEHCRRRLHRPDGRPSWTEVEEGTDRLGADPARNFTASLTRTLEEAEEDMMGATRLKVPDEETDIICEKCGRHMVIKAGRYGKFLACPGYPGMQEHQEDCAGNTGESARCAAEKSSPKNPKRARPILAASTIPSARL